MKIYRAWTDSMSRIQYTLGYFADFEDARKSLPPDRTTASPDCGVEEIEVIGGTCKDCGHYDKCDSFDMCNWEDGCYTCRMDVSVGGTTQPDPPNPDFGCVQWIARVE